MSDFTDKDLKALEGLYSNEKLILSNSDLNVLELNDFLLLDLPPRELLLSPWLPKSGLCMLHAFRGVGKTHVSLGIAYAVASGKELLGWKAVYPANVLYIDGEMPAATLQVRLKGISVMFGGEEPRGRLKIITPDLQKNGSMPDLATVEGQEAINQYITDEIDLIIIDNLSCLAPSIKENDSSDWTNIQTWVLGLRARGKSVLLIHHSGKSGSQRGSSRKEDVLDTVITLERPKDYESSQGARFVVKFEKSRGFCGEEAKPFEAQLCSDTTGKLSWKTQTLENSNYEKVVNMLNNGDSQKDITIALGINKSNVSRHAQRARKEGLLKGNDSDE